MKQALPTAEQLRLDWTNNPRWTGIERPYSAEDVVRLRGTVAVEHSLARLGADKLWRYLQTEDFVNALGALTGNQAMQQVKAGLKAIYLSGWQVAADANLAGEMYPDQSLYPANSVPQVVKRINNTLLHGLVAGERAERVHEVFGLQVAPQLLGAEFRDRMFDRHGAAQAYDVVGAVRAFDAGPARGVGPVDAELFGGRKGGLHRGDSLLCRWTRRGQSIRA